MCLMLSCVPALLCVLQADAAGNSPTPAPIAGYLSSTAMDLLMQLVRELDYDGRYALLTSMANQLRYPNSHTSFFSAALLHVFAECGDELAKEQLTRVLLERLVVHRPHPWGLLVTFTDLVKNPRFGFWGHAFTRSSPEVQRLFESVARFCMPAGTTLTGAGDGEGATELSSSMARLSAADR